MTPDQPEEAEDRKRWGGLGYYWIPIGVAMYVLSYGPVHGMLLKQYSASGVMPSWSKLAGAFYAPLAWVGSASSLFVELLGKHAIFWARLFGADPGIVY